MKNANLPEQIKLTDLTPDNVKLLDLPRFPPMTGWFKPVLLGKLLLKVIISDVFGQYADRRLIQAALDTVSKDKLRDRADVTAKLVPDKGGAIWIDYVADLGDGFDATYAIAYLLAQPSLKVGELNLPRGSALIMGGDEVYPTAARDDYTIRTRKPYSFALPDKKGQDHPPVLLLPGNHDWYDGLINFLAIFCREKQTPIGDWRTNQRRSYFAAKLNDNWWVWGIDIALVRDMDQPQADYFVSIAEGMPERANIILCSAEPGWYMAESGADSFRSLGYAAWIAENAKTDLKVPKELKIPLVLSGDSHHYTRYSGCGAHFITSGGGGAFVHGTLGQKDKIDAEWLRERAVLSLTTTADEKHLECDVRACYPTREESRKLLKGNWSFYALNPQFSYLLGGIYALCAFALTSLPRWDVFLFIYLILASGFVSYAGYQEKFTKRVVLLSAAHAFAHFCAIVGFSVGIIWLSSHIYSFEEWHWLIWLLFLAAIIIPLGGMVAGTIFGVNLLVTCRYFDLNHNDAFSSLQLNSHRHFLRIRILGDVLTIYPIALDKVPRRDEWQANPNRNESSPSVFLPPESMKWGLVEGPIEIRAREAPTTVEVEKSPALPLKG